MLTAETASPDDASRKRLETLKARAALLGIELLVTTDDAACPLYVITQWATTRHVRTMDALESTIATIEAATYSRRLGGPGI